jgi:hypothetical protein
MCFLHINALKKSDIVENRRSERIGLDLNDCAEIGRRRIMRMVNELTSPQEIGAHMVNLYFNQTSKLLLNSSSIPITAILTSSESNIEVILKHGETINKLTNY